MPRDDSCGWEDINDKSHDADTAPGGRQAQSFVPGVRYIGPVKQIERRIFRTFPEINRINKVTSRLSDLSEDMRILSLNAELVAGRAGQRGVAVRALTQYTRGLVRRLVDINADVSNMRALYGTISHCLSAIGHLGRIERATANIGTAIINNKGNHAADSLDEMKNQYMEIVSLSVVKLCAEVAKLTVMVRVVDEIVSQAASIATNIATEAVSAGLHQKEFNAVAESMQHYVEELQEINNNIARGLRGASEQCQAMQDIVVVLVRRKIIVR